MLSVKNAVKVHSKGLSGLGHTFEQSVCCELVVKTHFIAMAR
jgi:hypothetical protein